MRYNFTDEEKNFIQAHPYFFETIADDVCMENSGYDDDFNNLLKYISEYDFDYLKQMCIDNSDSCCDLVNVIYDFSEFLDKGVIWKYWNFASLGTDGIYVDKRIPDTSCNEEVTGEMYDEILNLYLNEM